MLLGLQKEGLEFPGQGHIRHLSRGYAQELGYNPSRYASNSLRRVNGLRPQLTMYFFGAFPRLPRINFLVHVGHEVRPDNLVNLSMEKMFVYLFVYPFFYSSIA